MADALFWIIIVIIIIGILVIGLPLLGLAIFLWWIVFPILGAWVGGWTGFFFGVGLAVVIYCIYLAIKGVAKDFQSKKDLNEEGLPKDSSYPSTNQRCIQS